MLGQRLNSAHVVVLAAVVFAATGCGASHDLGDLDAGRSEDATPVGYDRIDIPVPDAGADAGARTACSADDAHSALCPASLCDGLPRWYWNGDDCFMIDCGACEGTECDHGTASRDACFAAHSTCVPALCRTTGGSWLWWAEECGHYACGHPPPAICESGSPVCDCGTNRVFDAERGCVDMCGIVDPLPRNVLCTSTGGAWGGICCDAVCGQLCDLACAADACNCGAGKIFDAERGCIESARCHDRLSGETCEGAARCESGTICCQRCGGAGCFGPPTCQAPVCDSDPHTDECGNDDRAA